MMNPRVTVLMPVYNAARYLREAVESILAQTYTDFEFLIIDDGSTDTSKSIIEQFTDPRIRLVANDSNLKLSATLNKGIELSRGEYVARMDADDISLANRLARQVEYLDRNAHVAICGTWYTLFGDVTRKEYRPPADHRHLRCFTLFHCPFAHPSVMFRRSAFVSGGFRFKQEYSPAEDYQCWTQLLQHEQGGNIAEFLFLYRAHSAQMTQSLTYIPSDAKLEIGYKIFAEQLETLEIVPTRRELHVHYLIANIDFENNYGFLLEARRWLVKLFEANLRVKTYDTEAFSALLAEMWFRTCNEMTFLGIRGLMTYYKSPPQLIGKVETLPKSIFMLKCLIVWDRYGIHEKINTAIARLKTRKP